MKVGPFLPLFIELAKRKTKQGANHIMRDTLLSVVAKILSGIVLSSVIVFSLVLVGQHINDILLTQQHGRVLSIAVFVFLAVVSSVALILVLRTRKEKEADLMPAVDLQRLFTTFCEGLSEGAQKKSDELAKRQEAPNSSLEGSGGHYA